MKWIGQHIVDLIARFRSDVYLDNPTAGDTDPDKFLALNSSKKVVYRTGAQVLSDIGAGTGTVSFDGSTANGILTYKDADEAQVESGITFDGNELTLESSGEDTPIIEIKNTSNDVQAGQLKFNKNRADNNVSTGTNCGEIWFSGEDDEQAAQDYAYIVGEIDVGTASEESGKLIFGVASHNGTNQSGIEIVGGREAGEVDVTVGRGQKSVVTVPGDLTVNGDTVTFESATGDSPTVIIKNTTNDNQAARLQFYKDRGAAAVDSDRIAELDFFGEDASQNSQQYGKILVQAKETAHGNEAGKVAIQVAQYDGSIGLNGLVVEGSKITDDTIDVTIGYGANSRNTINGTLTIGSALAFNNSGEIQVATQPSITTLAGLTSLGAAGATTDIAAGDLTMYNAVDNGNPSFSIGSSATNRLVIQPVYNSGAQTVDYVEFNTYTTSSTSHDGRYFFKVDEVEIARIIDTGALFQGLLQTSGDGAKIVSKDTQASNTNTGAEVELRTDDGAAMANNHRLGVIKFTGAEDASATITTGAQIEAFCEADWTSSENGAKLVFSTTDGNASTSTALTLDSNRLATFSGAVTIEGNLTFDSVGLTAIQTSSESHSDNDTSAMTSAAILDLIQSKTFLTPYHFIGYTIGDGSNYEHPQNLTDNQSPFEHASTSSADGLTIPAASGTNVSEIMRFGGKLMATAGTLTKWVGVGTCTNNKDLTLGLFKWTPVDNTAGDITPVLLDEVVLEGKGNDKTRTFSTTSFTQASVAAGDIIFTQMKTESSGNVGYFNSTLEVLH